MGTFKIKGIVKLKILDLNIDSTKLIEILKFKKN